jgi:hypothetical protein
MFEAELAATAQLTPDVLTNDDLSRFRSFLDSRCGVDAVAVQIAVRGHSRR